VRGSESVPPYASSLEGSLQIAIGAEIPALKRGRVLGTCGLNEH